MPFPLLLLNEEVILLVEYFIIGKIINVHGIKGELKVMPETDDPNRFKKLKKVRVEQKGTITEYECRSARMYNDCVLLTLKGVDTREKAEALKNSVLSVPRSEAINLPEDRFFIADLIGCAVFEETGECLGKITDVYQPGGNDVYEVVNDAGKEILIPALKQVVLSVDIGNKKIIVKLLPGLKEVYYEN